MKILIFMSDNRFLSKNYNNAEYNSYVACINYEYCKKYNYDFIYYRPYLDNIKSVVLNNCKDPNSGNLRHAAWSKLLSTNIALELSYDYIVYIDSDCIFKNFNKSLEDFINLYNKPIIFLNNKPWGDTVPCSGFYICKVSSYTKKFIKDWYNVCIPTRNIYHAWEQDALWQIFRNYDIAIVDQWMFREEDDQLLRHVASWEKEKRLPYFRNFIHVNGIDYSRNIMNINVVEYNTSYA